MEKPILEVQNLRCERSGKMILQQISFSVMRGEYISIVGPNGAGKSTLLKCLARILPVGKESELRLEGQSAQLFSTRQWASRIAYVPQTLPQPFAFSVQHFVAMGRYAHQKPWERESVLDDSICCEAMERTGVTAFAQRTLDTLSGGELQRVAVAASLAQQAEIWMLDESFSQLDYRFRQEISELLYQLNVEGKTILSVSHDLNYAGMDAGRILALQDGTIRYDGSPGGFLRADTLEAIYGTPFTLLETLDAKYPVVVPNRLRVPR